MLKIAPVRCARAVHFGEIHRLMWGHLPHRCNRHAHDHYPKVYATLHHHPESQPDATGYHAAFLSRTR